MGVGLVIGLAGTGDGSLPSQQVLTNILRNSGLIFSPDELDADNIALVMVTAELGPFDRVGSTIDVDVSSIGKAESLKGGKLLPTPLEGLDGQVYAVTNADGVSVGGWAASGENASITKNHMTVGHIPSGAIVEREEVATFVENLGGHRYVTMNLRNSDFSTANEISKSVNERFPEAATIIDAGTIRVKVPGTMSDSEIPSFIDKITQMEVSVDTEAVVVINERTGTIVVGENVRISSVAISQGSLVVKIRETADVSQPVAPFSDAGRTVEVPETMLEVEEQEGALIPVKKTVTVSDLANTLNAIGASPTDLIAIFNALKKAGALQAKLEIM